MSTLLRVAGASRGTGRMALFQLSSEWQEQGVAAPELGGCEVTAEFTASGSIHNELSLTVVRSGKALDLVFGYNTGLWTEHGAHAWSGGVESVLTQALADPGTRVGAFTAGRGGAEAFYAG
ncbi:hypothetical protein HFP72_29500 [Nocardiopsis sp. ARC36]